MNQLNFHLQNTGDKSTKVIKFKDLNYPLPEDELDRVGDKK